MPGGMGRQSGGNRLFVGLLAKAAVAVGADALFMKVHDNPDLAKSDPATQYPLDRFEQLMATCLRVASAIRE